MKSFIKLPNAIWSYRLSSGELQVYTALTAFANRFGACCVRHATVAELCGVSSATVARAIGQLSSKGLISISKRYDRQGQLVANKYLVTPLSGSFTRVPCNIWGYKLAKSDFKVYLYLLCCCAQNILEAVPSLSQMVSVLHMSKRTIIDAVNRLSQLLLLYKEQYRRKQDKRMGHNRYRLIIGMARRLLV
ncbi:MAG: helix-turn-helix domain-containing protein, partial [Angelakisella sp.]